jgi:hypothetical protein
LRNIYIKYPIAFHKITKELVDIADVTNDNKMHLICQECKENFIAVQNHPTPHFKHKPKSTCKGNVETYLHWLAKDTFKLINEIELPEIFIHNLTYIQRVKLKEDINRLVIKHNVPKALQLKFKNELKKELSNFGKYQIKNIELEKEFKTSLGNVRIDIVATINKEKLFIEPFYTSRIGSEKIEKLILINTPTVAIDLIYFTNRFKYKYKLEDFKNYLISKECKTWVINKEEQLKKHLSNYLIYVVDEIKGNQDKFKSHNEQVEKLSELKSKVDSLVKKIRPTQEEIIKLSREITKLNKKLGLPDYEL